MQRQQGKLFTQAPQQAAPSVIFVEKSTRETAVNRSKDGTQSGDGSQGKLRIWTIDKELVLFGSIWVQHLHSGDKVTKEERRRNVHPPPLFALHIAHAAGWVSSPVLS